MSEKIGFLFPGQGSQAVGMGYALVESRPDLRKLYEDASTILGYDLAALCFEGPAEQLNKTEFTQPALLVTSVVALRALGSGLEPVAVAGHSLGEYSAIVAAGGLGSDMVNKAQVDMTLDVMANSLVYWTQDLVAADLLGQGGRIFAMTSAGGARVWRTYGAVSAAKAALESHIRQLTLELAPLGITANAIMAGVTDTPALRKIPGSDQMLTWAKRKNPSGRLTLPKDVAEAIGLLSHPKAQWITGNVLCVDGGEFIVD